MSPVRYQHQLRIKKISYPCNRPRRPGYVFLVRYEIIYIEKVKLSP
jgi:hypothetical protein